LWRSLSRDFVYIEGHLHVLTSMRRQRVDQEYTRPGFRYDPVRDRMVRVNNYSVVDRRVQNITFNVVRNLQNGNLHVLRMTPVLNAATTSEAEMDLVRNYARSLRSTIVYQLMRNTGWNEQRARSNVSGYLAVTTNDTSFASMAVGTLDRLNEASLTELLARIQQSETELEIGQLTWIFTIDPNVFRQGAGGPVKKPSWWPNNKNVLAWKEYPSVDGHIACLAIALVLAMNGIDGEKFRYDRRVDLLTFHARNLQTQLGWASSVGLNRLKDFVDAYPKFRLTCLMPHEKDSKNYTFVGTEYDHSIAEPGKRNPKFALYIYYDMEQNHFVNVTSPQEFYRSKLNSRSKFCHSCLVAATGSHTCTELHVPVRKQETACEKCGLFGNHKCDFVKCRNCQAKYRANWEKHRCVLFEETTDEQGWNTVENDGKKPSLWVYDLESRIQKKHVAFHVIQPVFDQEFYYSGEIVNVENIVDEQIANFVYARNVFTNEEVVVY